MEIKNKVCKPSRSKANEAKAMKCLKHMLVGGAVNRIMLDELGIGAKNDSAHTMMSTLRNQRYVPIISKRSENGTCNYYILADEIERYKDPVLRRRQAEEMKAHVDEKRTHTLIERFLNFLSRVRNSPALRRHVKSSKAELREISTEINALLNSEEQEKR